MIRPGRSTFVVGAVFLVTVALVGCSSNEPAPPIESKSEGVVKSTHDHAPPPKVINEAEKILYLTPGGTYTAADIEANGNITAVEKFEGVKANHDLRPKAGEKICPITLTKANSQFSWVIGGKTYEFCCPPCVDEFVLLAKEQPEEIQDPEFYRKK